MLKCRDCFTQNVPTHQEEFIEFGGKTYTAPPVHRWVPVEGAFAGGHYATASEERLEEVRIALAQSFDAVTVIDGQAVCEVHLAERIR